MSGLAKAASRAVSTSRMRSNANGRKSINSVKSGAATNTKGNATINGLTRSR